MVFDRYASNYREILSEGFFYPTRNSTGFAERNLSVNFARAYQSLNPSAVCWYEFQFGEKNDLHMDAILIDRARRTLLLVESKRLKGKKKEEEIREDVRRIENGWPELFDGRISGDLVIDEIYGVILADIWTMKWSEKKKCYKPVAAIEKYKEQFENGTFAARCMGSDARKRGEAAHYITPVPVRDGEGYHLASFVWKLK